MGLTCGVRQVHTIRPSTGCHRLWPSGSAMAAGVARAAGESDRYGSAAGHVVALRRHTVTMRPYGIESARTLRSYEAADGCTVLMKDPLLVIARAKPLRAPSTLHSEQATAWQVVADDVHGAVARFERGAVAGAAIVPDGAAAGRRGSRTASCGASTDAGLLSAACEHGAHGEVDPGACGCSYALSGNACAACQRWGRGARDAAAPRHGRQSRRRALSVGGEGRRLQNGPTS